MKGQSAIEYLMTYGWMLLVVAITGGAIFSITGNQGIETTTGFNSNNLGVQEFGVTENGNLNMVLQSKTNSPVKIESITVNGTKSFEGIGGPEIAVSEQKQITLPGIQQKQNTNSIDVRITYSQDQLKNLTAQGTITGNLDVENKSKINYTGKSYSKLKASGGNQTTTTINNQKYRIHAFEATGQSNFIVDEAINAKADILLVGGGGGGGSDGGGGGGAGGLIYETISLDSESYTVYVGSGGNGDKSPDDGINADNGENTTAFSLEAIGGGGGASWNANKGNNGSDGGSGGGAAGSDYTNAGGESLQSSSNDKSSGNRGGSNANNKGGAGGGGAAEIGQNSPSGSEGGNGGSGLDFSEEFGTNYGENGFFAGGGGGGHQNGGATGGEGGLGGGADSNADSVAPSGEPNTGGGGAGSSGSGGHDGGNGGSGIVLIRYAIR